MPRKQMEVDDLYGSQGEIFEDPTAVQPKEFPKDTRSIEEIIALKEVKITPKLKHTRDGSIVENEDEEIIQ
jgi:hypothetical protein